jgi:hypothetical protein
VLKIVHPRKFATTFLTLLLITTGCSNSTPENSPTSTAIKPSNSVIKELYIATISWKDPYGGGGKCETGLEVANFWFEGSSVAVYDSDSGELLGTTSLKSKKDDPESRICDYKSTISVREVQNYRFVFEKGRWEVNKTLADLKIMASEYPFAELVFIYELGA